jgi:hypothetical protein
MRKKLISGFVLVVFASAMCFTCSDEVKTSDNFVIQAYLYANEKVKGIKISSTLPIQSTDTEPTQIEDASVILKKGSTEYVLQYDKISKSYFYPGTLEVKPADYFELSVKNKSRVASAATRVPPATKSLSLSDKFIRIPKIALNLGTRDQIAFLFAKARITATWDNTGNELHFVAIENLDKFDPIFPSDFPAGVIGLFRTFRFVSAPDRNNTYSIVGLSLESYGRYRIKVYRVNKEYADLFENQVQDSRDLNEPPSNVTNAFGLFSAFASDSAFFEIVRQ